MKIFITVELEENKALHELMSKEAYQRMMDTVDMFRKEGIPVQYKETNLPRFEPRWRRASELQDTEK